eukprot:457591-Prorocentrum_minimum.AAC.3
MMTKNISDTYEPVSRAGGSRGHTADTQGGDAMEQDDTHTHRRSRKQATLTRKKGCFRTLHQTFLTENV